MATPLLSPENMSLIQRLSPGFQTGYEVMHQIVGSDTLSIMPLCDPLYGKPNSNTFTAKDFHSSGSAAVGTWTESAGEVAGPWTDFDAHKGLNDANNKYQPYKFQGFVPVIHLNSTDESINIADSAFWTFGSAAYSLGIWVNINDGDANGNLWTKFDLTSGAAAREFRIYFNADTEVVFDVWDETNDASIGRTYGEPISQNTWHNLIFTYNGGTTSAGIKIYLDGADVGDSDAETGTGFSAVVDQATAVRIGSRESSDGNAGGFFGGMIAGADCGPWAAAVALTAAQVTSVYDYQRVRLGLT